VPVKSAPTADLCDQNQDLQLITPTVSHNLRAPIANALGLINLLTDPRPGEDLYLEIIKNLKISIRQIDAVVKDLDLIFSMRDHNDPLPLEKVAFEHVFTQVMLPLSVSLQDCQGQINLQVPEGYTLRSHQAYLSSILYHLISNAISYRSPRRPLQIDLKCAGTPEKGTLITCADNGLGMDLKAVGKNLFRVNNQFHQGAPGRSNGLYLVKTHVQTLGGRIDVISSPDQGTRFLIHLP
jgi:signal transduction histidine kinase